MTSRRILPTTEAEARFWLQGHQRVAGLDEAGRGAWAGPVVAAAVILPPSRSVLRGLTGVRDSKTMSARQREAQYAVIHAVAVAVGTGQASAAEIDALGIVPATRLAMTRAIHQLRLPPHVLLIDALALPEISLPQAAFPHADATSLSVACAGIIAKVTRDRWMVRADGDYPGYGFAQHKGYGTSRHRAALESLGVCAIHRRTFRPVAARLGGPACAS